MAKRISRITTRAEPLALGVLVSFLFCQQRAQYHDEMTANTARVCLLIDDSRGDRMIQLDFCHPALDLPTRVLLLPVEALAAPRSPRAQRDCQLCRSSRATRTP